MLPLSFQEDVREGQVLGWGAVSCRLLQRSSALLSSSRRPGCWAGADRVPPGPAPSLDTPLTLSLGGRLHQETPQRVLWFYMGFLRLEEEPQVRQQSRSRGHGTLAQMCGPQTPNFSSRVRAPCSQQPPCPLPKSVLSGRVGGQLCRGSSLLPSCGREDGPSLAPPEADSTSVDSWAAPALL